MRETLHAPTVALDELGFRRGCIVETIVTTRRRDGTTNAAPMGVTRVGLDLLEIKPFKSSSTYRNMLDHGEACINVTQDPELYLVTAFKKEKLEGFQHPKIGKDLCIQSASACIQTKVLQVTQVSEERSSFTCQVYQIQVQSKSPEAFSRGKAQAIEAVIHSTRIKTFLSKGQILEAEKLINRFSECKEVVERVSPPDTVEVKVLHRLETLIDRWRE